MPFEIDGTVFVPSTILKLDPSNFKSLRQVLLLGLLLIHLQPQMLFDSIHCTPYVLISNLTHAGTKALPSSSSYYRQMITLVVLHE